MVMRANPFQELYLSEAIPPDEFVELFSSHLVQYALAVFQPGNVIIKGVQGSGKSMLLSLLKPDILIAYRCVEKELPLPQEVRRFISAGINITRSAAIDFGHRPVVSDPDGDMEMAPFYFGDFFNYWIINDIFRTLDKLRRECNGVIAHEWKILFENERLHGFVNGLIHEPCWFGYLDKVCDYDSLKVAVQNRLQAYRAFLNFNADELPKDIQDTKTPVGEPISRVAEWLWKTEIVPRSIPFFIRIDQYEELSRLGDWSLNDGLHTKYQQVINKVLGRRDPRVSYKIGTRRYAWQNDLQIFGSSSGLELNRDYNIVDIDEVLRRQENRRQWVFPDFAHDVMRRRLQHAKYDCYNDNDDLVKRVFGAGITPSEKARKYARMPSAKILTSTTDMPQEWVSFLTNLATENPLSAKLGEAWARQQKGVRLQQPIPFAPYPWEQTRKYWRKERIQQALMQIAGQYAQRMIWSGKDEILSLSGGNILVFISICKEIWDAWVRSNRGQDKGGEATTLPTISTEEQTVGIYTASTYWYDKIPEQPGGSMRQRFVNFVGNMMREELLGDRLMSYPGHNGFSLRLDELELHSDLQAFLNSAVDYGDLYNSLHTTKEKNRKSRQKWYLKPILSAYFQLPVSHEKEPKYVTAHDVDMWRNNATGMTSDRKQLSLKDKDDDQSQLLLFVDSEGD